MNGSISRLLTLSMRSTRRFMVTTALVASGFVISSQAPAEDLTLPQGGQVVGGEATISLPQPGQMDINQGTDRAVINWDSFNIGTDAKTQFYQPSSNALAVNRVVGPGQDPTQILGTLKANGRVMVLDRNGVLFGQDSRIDVGGIVASTGDVDNNAVMRGDDRIQLKNFGDGAVINQGTINVSESGLAAFVAPTVKNAGAINAKLGKVSLAAGGETATVDLYGDGLVEMTVGGDKGKALAENSGAINAAGGTIQMTTAAAKGVVDNVINMEGVVSASSVEVEGGKIILKADNGTVNVGGTLEADGQTGGGDIDVTGKNVNVSGNLKANATGAGNGGTVNVVASETTRFTGKVAARGAGAAGKGGKAEISGKAVHFDGETNLGAENGALGRLLIDPTFAVIHSGALDDPFGLFAILSAQALANSMETADVTVQADDFIDVGTNKAGYNTGDAATDATLNGLDDGDVDLTTWISGPDSGTTAGSLTLESDTVNFNRNLTMGNGSVIVDAGDANLDAKISGIDGGSTVKLDATRLSGNAAQVNVLSDSASIQQGLDVVGDNGIVTAAAGTYDEDLTMTKDGVTLEGAKAGVDGVDASRGAGETLVTRIPGIVVTGNNVTVDGMMIDGADNGILIDGANNATVKNNVVVNSTDTGIRGFGGNKATVTGNLVDGAAQDGINILKNTGDVTVSGNTIRNTGDEGIEVHGSQTKGSNGIFAINNNVVDGTAGTGVKGDGIQIEYSTVQTDVKGNQVLGVKGDAVEIHNSNNITVSGNKLQNSGDQGVEINGGDTFSVTNNDIDGAKHEGVYAAHMTGANLVDGNTVGNTKGDGISVGYTENLTVTGNTATGIGGTAIRVKDSHNVTIGKEVADDTIFSNKIKNAAQGIVVSGGSAVKVVKNFVDTVKTYGIRIMDVDGSDIAHPGALVLRNHVTHGENGIRVQDSDFADIGSNVTENMSNDGIQVSGGNGDRIRSNRSDKVGRDAFHVVNSTNAHLEVNRGYATGRDVFNLSDADGATIVNNFAGTDLDGISKGGDNVKGNGFRITNSDNVTIVDNTAKDTVDAAIRVKNSDHVTIGKEVADDTIFSNKTKDTGYGVVVDGGTDIKIVKNLIDTTDHYGVRVRDVDGSSIAAPGALILRNHVNHGNTGIRVQDSDYADIASNVTENLTNDGIQVSGGNGDRIRSNRSDKVGGDGFHIINSTNAHVEVNRAYLTGGDAFSVANSDGATLHNNFAGSDLDSVSKGVENVKGDGFKIVNSDNATITDNSAKDVVGAGIRVSDSDHVTIGKEVADSTIFSNRIKDAGAGIVVKNGTDIKVVKNFIDTVDTTGIRVTDVDGASIAAPGALILRNHVTHGENGIRVQDSDYADIGSNVTENLSNDGIQVSGGNGVRIRSNRSDKVGHDAFHVTNSTNAHIEVNRGYLTGDDVFHLTAADGAVIVNNFAGSDLDGVSKGAGNVKGDGFAITNTNGITLTGNHSTDALQNGVLLTGVDNAILASNIIVNSGAHGLFAAGPDNGSIVLTGNSFTGNPVGAGFESGAIDLTGAANTFENGTVGLLFAPFDLGGGLFANMSLIGDTIGTTNFIGQSQYYIQLTNGAFFAPGSPTLLDGLNATYDGLTPSLTGGVLPQSDYDALEDKIFHFNDDPSLGLFFFGVPDTSAPVGPTGPTTFLFSPFSIEQEDVYNSFATFNVPGGGMNLTITGLPGARFAQASVPQTQPQTGGVTNLANIEPAAGGDETGKNTGQQDSNVLKTPESAPQDIEPAAGGSGGETSTASCWGDALQGLDSGKSVSYSFGTGATGGLSAASGCQSSL